MSEKALFLHLYRLFLTDMEAKLDDLDTAIAALSAGAPKTACEAAATAIRTVQASLNTASYTY